MQVSAFEYFYQPKKQRKRAKFSREEDEQLRDLVSTFGENWKIIAQKMPGRNNRQVRERWTLYLAIPKNNAPWTLEEEELLRQKVLFFGRRWAQFPRFFVNRSAIQIKTHYLQMELKMKSNPLPISNIPAPPQPMEEYQFDAASDDNFTEDEKNWYPLQ